MGKSTEASAKVAEPATPEVRPAAAAEGERDLATESSPDASPASTTSCTDAPAAPTQRRAAVLLERYAAGERHFERAKLGEATLGAAMLDGADLSDADLGGADLAGASLRRVRLTRARLVDADLRGAQLAGALLREAQAEGANLRGVDLRDATCDRANLTGANLLHAQLGGADLSQARLARADLRGSDLQDATLEGASGLRITALADADLSGCALPAGIDLRDLVSHVEEASKVCRTLLSTLVLACAYTGLTMVRGGDTGLVAHTHELKLPILDVQISTLGFYYLAPLLVLAAQLYFLLSLHRMWERRVMLPRTFPDGRTAGTLLHPWLLASPPGTAHAGGPSHALQAGLSGLLAWWLAPLTLYWVWGRGLVRNDGRLALSHLVLVTAAIGASQYFRAQAAHMGRIRRSDGEHSAGPSGMRALAAAMAVFMALFMLTAMARLGDRAQLQAVGHWTRMLGYHPVPTIHAYGETLTRAQFYGAYLAGGDFQRANLVDADLRNATLDGATLIGADLSGSFLSHASLRDARLQKANLTEATLPGAQLLRASLLRARLNGALLHDARLDGADLRHAALIGTDLRRASLRGADLRGAQLAGTPLQGADLAEADFRNAVLQGVDLTGARGLSSAHFEGACGTAVRTPASLQLAACN